MNVPILAPVGKTASFFGLREPSRVVDIPFTPPIYDRYRIYEAIADPTSENFFNPIIVNPLDNIKNLADPIKNNVLNFEVKIYQEHFFDETLGVFRQPPRVLITTSVKDAIKSKDGEFVVNFSLADKIRSSQRIKYSGIFVIIGGFIMDYIKIDYLNIQKNSNDLVKVESLFPYTGSYLKGPFAYVKADETYVNDFFQKVLDADLDDPTLTLYSSTKLRILQNMIGENDPVLTDMSTQVKLKYDSIKALLSIETPSQTSLVKMFDELLVDLNLPNLAKVLRAQVGDDSEILTKEFNPIILKPHLLMFMSPALNLKKESFGFHLLDMIKYYVGIVRDPKMANITFYSNTNIPDSGVLLAQNTKDTSLKNIIYSMTLVTLMIKKTELPSFLNKHTNIVLDIDIPFKEEEYEGAEFAFKVAALRKSTLKKTLFEIKSIPQQIPTITYKVHAFQPKMAIVPSLRDERTSMMSLFWISTLPHVNLLKGIDFSNIDPTDVKRYDSFSLIVSFETVTNEDPKNFSDNSTLDINSVGHYYCIEDKKITQHVEIARDEDYDTYYLESQVNQHYWPKKSFPLAYPSRVESLLPVLNPESYVKVMGLENMQVEFVFKRRDFGRPDSLYKNDSIGRTVYQIRQISDYILETEKDSQFISNLQKVVSEGTKEGITENDLTLLIYKINGRRDISTLVGRHGGIYYMFGPSVDGKRIVLAVNLTTLNLEKKTPQKLILDPIVKSLLDSELTVNDKYKVDKDQSGNLQKIITFLRGQNPNLPDYFKMYWALSSQDSPFYRRTEIKNTISKLMAEMDDLAEYLHYMSSTEFVVQNEANSIKIAKNTEIAYKKFINQKVTDANPFMIDGKYSPYKVAIKTQSLTNVLGSNFFKNRFEAKDSFIESLIPTIVQIGMLNNPKKHFTFDASLIPITAFITSRSPGTFSDINPVLVDDMKDSKPQKEILKSFNLFQMIYEKYF